MRTKNLVGVRTPYSVHVLLKTVNQFTGVIMNLPNVELVAARVHAAWMETKLAAGVTSRKSESGEELMVPYEQLTEEAKELDRASVKAVYQAIRSLQTVA